MVWTNDLPMKVNGKSESRFEVNLFECEEINFDGEIVCKNSWMTDLTITKDNVRKMAKAGPDRFEIEKRNFNEQKNLGFHTGHNYRSLWEAAKALYCQRPFFRIAQISQLITDLFCK